MSGYTKFSGITKSSLWMMSDAHIRVWNWFLDNSDATGFAMGSAPTVAHACFKTLEEFEKIVDDFESPDAYSRTPDDDGRRLRRMEGGWKLTNYLKYRGLCQPDKSTPRVQEHRKKRETEKPLHETGCNGSNAQAEAEAEAEAEAIKEEHSSAPPSEERDSAPKSKEPKPRTDPLQSVPKIGKQYDAIRLAVSVNHPRAKLPDDGTEAEWKDRQALEQLVRLDGYTESDVIRCLSWVCKEEIPGPTGFCWRDQFRSIAHLRKKSSEGATMHKFAMMFEAWNKSKTVTNGRQKTEAEIEAERIWEQARRAG